MKKKPAEISQFDHLDALNKECAGLIVTQARKAIKQRGGFSLALSGGTTPKSLYTLLGTPEISRQIDWQKVHFFWGDERCVPPDHPASNYKMVQDSLLSKIPIHPSHIYRMKGELEPWEGAENYEKVLRGVSLLWKPSGPDKKMPVFDLFLLGLGNDGHTASMFPGTNVLTEKNRFVCAVPSPDAEPAVPRLTLTIPAINNARQVWFIAAGPRKKALADKILSQDSAQAYPAAQIKPQGTLQWFLAP